MNVALNRPSYQISTLTYSNVTYYAKYGNDGIRETNCFIAKCAHIELATNPWWAVDLGVALHVWGIMFTNRGDSYGTLCDFFPANLTAHGTSLLHHLSKQTNFICVFAHICVEIANQQRTFCDIKQR